jgi:hypothetical protein
MGTPELRAAYVYSQSVAALIEAMGMAAANAQHHLEQAAYLAEKGNKPHGTPYTEKEFKAVIEKYGIHHNAVVSYMEGA